MRFRETAGTREHVVGTGVNKDGAGVQNVGTGVTSRLMAVVSMVRRENIVMMSRSLLVSVCVADLPNQKNNYEISKIKIVFPAFNLPSTLSVMSLKFEISSF